MVLSDKNRELILILQKNPLASYVDIANQINITSPTAKRRLDSLMGKHGEETIITGFSAGINQPSMSLENHSYLISLQGQGTKTAYSLLEQLGEYHPYTSYQNHIFGGINGMLLQFNSPTGATKKIEELLTTTAKEVEIDTITHIPHPEIQIESYPEIQYWQDGMWEFNFRDWLKQRNEGAFDDYQHQEDHVSLLNELSMTDIIIIRELMNNARRKQIEIMTDIREDLTIYSVEERELFNLKNQRHISRRFEYLEHHNIIREYRLLYNREVFGLFNQLLFHGTMSRTSKTEVLDALASATNPLPFRTSLRFVGDQYFWWFNLPPTQSAEAMNVIFELSEEMHLGILDSSPNHLRSYPIYHRNFDEVSKSWNISDDIMINQLKTQLFE